MIDAWGAAKQCLQRKEEGLGQLSCEMAKIGPKDAKSSQTWSKVTKSSQSKQPKPKVVKRPPKAAQKQPKAVKNCQRWPKAAFGRGRGEGTPPPGGRCHSPRWPLPRDMLEWTGSISAPKGSTHWGGVQELPEAPTLAGLRC